VIILWGSLRPFRFSCPTRLNMPKHASRCKPFSLAILCAVFLAVLSCGPQAQRNEKSDQALRLAGTWTLNARIADGVESSISERYMRLDLNPDATFRARYRGDQSQGWTKAGQGAFSYEPPYLYLYWESGAANTLLVSELDQNRLYVHHGRNLVPLKDQEPDEIFVREKIEKGPTRSPSS